MQKRPSMLASAWYSGQQKLGALRGQRVHDFPQKLVLVLLRETLPHGKNAFVPQLRFGYDRIGHNGRGGGNAAVCVRKAVFKYYPQ